MPFRRGGRSLGTSTPTSLHAGFAAQSPALPLLAFN